MRHDMQDVLLGRARNGVGYYSDLPNEYRSAKKVSLEDIEGGGRFGASRQPMRSRDVGWDGKRRNLHTQPLVRWAESCVGKRWDDCHAQLRARFDLSTKSSQEAFRLALGQVIERVARKRDGTLWEHSARGPRPIGPGDLYVDPADGVVKKMPKPPPAARSRRRARLGAQGESGLLVVSQAQRFLFIEGQWYEARMAPRSAFKSSSDALRLRLPEPAPLSWARAAEPESWHAISKRQASRAQIKAWGLRGLEPAQAEKGPGR